MNPSKDKLLEILESQLRAEHAVAAAFSAMGWNTTLQPYYRDLTTSKWRETDVLARLDFHRCVGNTFMVSHFAVVVEVKSAADSCVLLGGNDSEQCSYRSALMADLRWPSHRQAQREYDELRQMELDDSDRQWMSGNARARVIRELDGAAKAIVDCPIAPPHQFTAFVEGTAPSGSKTSHVKVKLENSVLWRGMSSLWDASLATLDDFERARWSYVHAAAEEFRDATAPSIGPSQFEAHREKFVSVLLGECAFSHIVHPLLVVDSELRALRPDSGSDLLEWCRLRSTTVGSRALPFVDVVRSTAINDYVRLLNEYVESVASERGWQSSPAPTPF